MLGPLFGAGAYRWVKRGCGSNVIAAPSLNASKILTCPDNPPNAIKVHQSSNHKTVDRSVSEGDLPRATKERTEETTDPPDLNR